MSLSTTAVERWTKLLTALRKQENYSKYKVIGGEYPDIRIGRIEIKQMITESKCVGLWLTLIEGSYPDEEFTDIDVISFKDAPEIEKLFDEITPLINAQANMNRKDAWNKIFKELGVEDHASI